MRNRAASREQAEQLGRDIIAAREHGISWKELGLSFGLSRTRLFVLKQIAEKREPVCKKQKKRR